MSARRKRSRRAPLAAGCLALVLLGLLAGRLTAPSPGGGRAAAPAAGAARTLAGVPVSFPRTRAGAAAAIAAYQRAFADPDVLGPGALRARIEAVATPDYAAAMLAATSPGQRRLAAGPIGRGLASGVATLYLGVPIGYRVESFAPSRARVLTWGLTLLGNASSVEPAAYFGLARTDLAWLGGRWRIAASRGGFGPTPRLATKPGPLGPYRVLGLLRRLRRYAPAP